LVFLTMALFGIAAEDGAAERPAMDRSAVSCALPPQTSRRWNASRRTRTD
jgi:hypothetical protein